MFKPERIIVPQPPMGCKCFLIEKPGMFVLEEGPGTLITDACTHAGAGALTIIDGVPNEQGFFPDEPIREHYDEVMFHELMGKRHGREMVRFPVVVMGSWMLNAGFHNGLTISVAGGHSDLSPIATIVWMPFRGVRA